MGKDLDAINKIEALYYIAEDDNESNGELFWRIALVGIIYALLYIGDCIKELKSEK